MILFILVISSISYACQFYDNQQYWSNIVSSTEIQNSNYQKLQTQEQLGLGFWLNYQPLSQKKNPDIYQNGLKSYFLLSLQNIDSSIFSVVVQINFNRTDQTIYFIAVFQTVDNQQIKINANINKFEGYWNLLYLYRDNINGYFELSIWNSEFNELITQQQQIQITFSNQISYSNQGEYNYKRNGEVYTLYRFQGRIGYVFNTGSYNIIQNFNEFILECPIIKNCINFTQDLIYNNIYIDSKIKYLFQSQQMILKSGYSLAGWVKINKIKNFQSLDTTILRITNSNQYQNQQKLGDRLLYIQYHQNKILELSGITLQSNSYTFPEMEEQYKSKETDFIKILGEQYRESIETWHYFQYEQYTNNNDGQPLYTIYFSHLDQTLQYKWPSIINQFSNSLIYFSIGSDDYLSNFFQGYLSDWVLTSYCEKVDLQFQVNCHFTCLTCSGISQYDCLSCHKEHNRIHSPEQKICTCDYGFIEQLNDGLCLELNQYNLAFSIVEKEIKCNKIGYFKCEFDNIQCDYGYFQIEDQCIQCPFLQQNNEKIILCANCIINPEIFNTSLQCTYDYGILDEYSLSSPLVNNTRVYDKFDLFTLKLDSQHQYQLELLVGQFSQTQCKYNHFRDKDGKCRQCTDGCQSCYSKDNCQQCIVGYILFEDRTCKKCSLCQNCFLDNGKEVCYYQDDCKQNQYWAGRVCIDCGQFCNQCNEWQCFSCQNDNNYYLTFDKWNCNKCEIENCEICFQYFFDGDYLYTTFDYENKFDLGEFYFETGCAQCKKDMFYNFNTHKCEQTYIEQCTFGIVDLNSDIVCIKSNLPYQGVQQVECSELQNCKECILNYQNNESFCIICDEGYYPTILTGQCLECQTNCKHCLQESRTIFDKYLWQIKAFYKYFINKDGSHPIEQYAYRDQDYEVKCQECYTGYLLIKNVCKDTCDDNCQDCRVQYYYLNARDMPTCFQCKKTIFGQIRSLRITDYFYSETYSECSQCSELCEACVGRDQSQITTINPYFSQPIFQHYSSVCFSSGYNKQINKQSNHAIQSYIIEPRLRQPIKCQNYKKCSKSFIQQMKIYCSTNQYKQEQQKDQRPNSQYIYYSFYQATVFGIDTQYTNQLFQLMNQQLIEEVIINFDIYDKQFDVNKCYQWMGYSTAIRSQFQSNVFSVKNVKINFQGNLGEQRLLLINIQNMLIIQNFTQVLFQQIQFNITKINLMSQIYEFQSGLNITNAFEPIDIFIYNTVFIMQQKNYQFKCSILCLITKNVKVENVSLINLNFTKSSFFNFQIKNSVNSATLTVKNLTLLNLNLTQASIFYFEANKFSLKYDIKLIDITILNSVFQQKSYFLNSSFQIQYDIGTIFLSNFYFENIVIKDSSIMFNLLSAKSCQLRNFTLKNVIFLEKSSFAYLNIIDLADFFISNVELQQGVIITNQGTKTQTNDAITNSKKFKIDNIVFKSIIYQQYGFFINIVDDLDQNIIVDISRLFLEDNTYYDTQKGKYTYNYLSFDQSLIKIECTICSFTSINIIRGIGTSEIVIPNSHRLIMKNIIISQSEKYTQKVLHSSIDCIRPSLYLDISYVIYFGTYNEIFIDSLIIENSIIFDSPFIIFGSTNIISANQQNLIKFQNSIFSQNMLLITKQNKQTAIIAISTELNVNITFENCNFTSNYLNEYYKDQQLYSSSTIFVNSQLGNILINNCNFDSNLITNSSDSNLFIKSKLLKISNTHFYQQNFVKQEIFLKHLFLVKNQNEVTQTVLDNFLILSQGGNGYFVINELLFENISIQNSQALNGGAFYIVTQQEGILNIIDSSFYNTSTVFNGYQLSSGGCFYIDSTKSRLNLNINNSQFENIFSRTFGGLLYIEPSHQNNQIILENLQILQVFSIQHSILSYSPSRLSSVTSNIVLQNCIIMNNLKSFDQFLCQIEDISSQDVEPFQLENSAIYVQFSNFTMFNCTFNEYHIAFVLEIYQCHNIELNNILISNSTIFQSPIIRISLRESTTGRALIQNVLISQINQFKPQEDFQCNNSLQIITNKDLKCPEDYEQSAQNVYLSQIIKNQQDLLNCNKKLLYQINKNNFSLFEILNVRDEQKYYLNNVQFTYILCQECYFGLISFIDFEFKNISIFLSDMKIQDNDCGIIGCLSFLQTSYFFQDASKKKRILQLNDEQITSIQSKEIQAILENSIFVNNTAYYGSACYLLEINILIKKCSFYNNIALQEGGAIFYESSQNNIILIDSSISNNLAQIAGGLRTNNLPIQKYKKSKVFLQDNNAQQEANNALSSAQSIQISFQNVILNKANILQNDTTIIEEVSISPYYYLGSKIPTNSLILPSGIKISQYQYFDIAQNKYLNYNLSLRLKAYNEFQEQIFSLDDTYCLIYASEVNVANFKDKINNVIQESNSQKTSINKVQFNSTTLDYNLDDLIVYFNPNNQIQSLQLTFYCDQIKIPQFKNQFPFELDYVINQYYLLLHIKTFQCQLGEYFNETSGGCIQCDVTQNQYSVTLNASSCSYKDEQKMLSIQPALIQLRDRFWRAYYYSMNIELCYHAEINCLGGWSAGNPSCILGHIGALCEQCDLYNIMGNGMFSISQQYSCGSCDNVAKNVINIIFVFLWTLLSVSLSVSSTVWMIEDFIVQLKLRFLYQTMQIRSTSTSVLLKVFTNYLQIISSITSFQLSIPIGITFVVNGLGNPMESMQFSLDCFLAPITSISIVYFRIVFSLLTIGLYILLFYIIYIVNLFIKKSKKISITFVTTTFIYIYIYLFPNIISGLVGLLSYRIISEQYWIAGNVSYLYNTDEHKIWLISFVIPCFSVFGLFIPFLFWFFVFYNRKKLNSPHIRKLWGYLYNEYKLETYYWETVKILQKELIIIVLLYYADYVAIKASLVFVILNIYSHLTLKHKPYQTAVLNQIDSQSTTICSISIILASSIYTAQSVDLYEVTYPFYSILSILNFYFVINIVIKIFSAYFDKFQKNVDYIKISIYSKFPTLINSSKTLKNFFTRTTNKKAIIQLRFKLVREYLLFQAKQLIEFKNQNNLDVASPKSSKRSEQTIITEPLSNTHRASTRLIKQQHTRVGSKFFNNYSIQKIQESKQE